MKLENFDIVGFDAIVPAVHCGTTRPFARLRGTQTVFRLSKGELPSTTSPSYNEIEFQAMVDSGRVTQVDVTFDDLRAAS